MDKYEEACRKALKVLTDDTLSDRDVAAGAIIVLSLALGIAIDDL